MEALSMTFGEPHSLLDANDLAYSWRVKESVLFLLQQVFEEIYYDTLVEAANPDFANACLDVFRGVFSDGKSRTGLWQSYLQYAAKSPFLRQ